MKEWLFDVLSFPKRNETTKASKRKDLGASRLTLDSIAPPDLYETTGVMAIGSRTHKKETREKPIHCQSKRKKNWQIFLIKTHSKTAIKTRMSLMFEAGSYWSTMIHDGIGFGSSMFAAGFVCGTVRVLLIEPKLGGDKWTAVCYEAPIMTMLSLWLSRRYRYHSTARDRRSGLSKQKKVVEDERDSNQHLMKNYDHDVHPTSGLLSLVVLPVVAFTTLLAWEVVLSISVFGKTLPITIHDIFQTREGRLGVALQAICSCFPNL